MGPVPIMQMKSTVTDTLLYPQISRSKRVFEKGRREFDSGFSTNSIMLPRNIPLQNDLISTY